MSIIRERILVVEDDTQLANLICEYLAEREFDVSTVADGHEALARITSEQPDLVILDIMLPGLKGTEICRRIRPGFKGMVLMLTALDDQVDQMLTLELGADDYVVKPVPPRLLLARVNALLRRASGPLSQSQKLQFGDVQIHTASRYSFVGEQQLELTSAEYELLLILLQAQGQPVGREELVRRLRGLHYDGLDRSVDRRISRLRKKLSVDGRERIETLRGKGYLLLNISTEQTS